MHACHHPAALRYWKLHGIRNVHNMHVKPCRQRVVFVLAENSGACLEFRQKKVLEQWHVQFAEVTDTQHLLHVGHD